MPERDPRTEPRVVRICGIIDVFSGALGSLPKKLHRDRTAVLRVLHQHPVFSVFDVDGKDLPRTMDSLKDGGFIEYPKPKPDYPWCRAKLTPRGLALLRGASE